MKIQHFGLSNINFSCLLIIGGVTGIFELRILIYIIIMMFFYSIIISIWIDNWKRHNKVIIETSKDRFIFVINGLSVKENISSLFNLLAYDERSLEVHFKKLFFLKLLFLLFFTGLSFYELNNILMQFSFNEQNYLKWFSLIINCIFSLYLLYQLITCLRILIFINQRRWEIVYQDHGLERYYGAYFENTEGSQIKSYTPFLALVFTY